MKPYRSILMTSLVLFLLSSCIPLTAFQPTQTPTPAPPTATATIPPTVTPKPPTPTSTQTPTLTATPTMEPFDYSSLPGWFAYSDFDCQGICTNISIIRPDFSDRQRLTNHTSGITADITWSPDEQKLVFTIYLLGDNGHPEIRMVDLATQTETTLVSVTKDRMVDHISWSPDGKKLIYSLHSQETDLTQIYSLDIQSHANVLLSQDSEVSDEFPVWSPDGQWIAFLSNRTAPEESARQVWIMTPDGANPRLLTPFDNIQNEQAIQLTWSPDGAQIAYLYTNASNTQSAAMLQPVVFHPRSVVGSETAKPNGLWLTDLEDGTPRLLSECETPANQPIQWSPDGTGLAYVCGEEKANQIIILSPDAQKSHLLTEEVGNYYAVSWSPDSKALIYMEEGENFSRKIHLVVFQKDNFFWVDSQVDMQDTIWSPGS